MSLNNLGIGKKLVLGFGIVLVLSSALGLVSIHRIKALSGEIGVVADIRVPQVGILYELMKSYDLIARSRANLIMTADAEVIQTQKANYEQGKKEMNEYLGKMEKTLQSAKGREMFFDIKKSLTAILEVSDKAVELGARQLDTEAADLLMHKVVEPQTRLLGLFDSFANYEMELARTDAAQTASNAAETLYLLILLGGSALVLGAGIAAFLGLNITKHLNRVISGLKDGAHQVAAASAQVAAASQELAEGSSEQAASLEETSSSLEEMASMTGQNAENASRANRLMGEAGGVVEKANSSMAGLISSMDEISRASEETEKIVKTIDEIAFQTNLLALNAAVEAARAGEAGAGFAVVADEVRNLAMRAAEAARTTAGLIEGTVKKIQDGSELVAATNVDFSEVSSSVAKTAEFMGEIAAACNEQAQGIDQLNRAVSEMDKVTQKNAANAEESASASEEMNAQAEQMKEFVVELAALVGGKGRDAGAEARQFYVSKSLPAKRAQVRGRGPESKKLLEIQADF